MPSPPLPHHQPHSTNEPTRSHKRPTNLPSTYLLQQYHHHRLLRGWGASSTARASNGVSGEGAHVDRHRSHHARGTNDDDDSYKLGLRSEGRLWLRIIIPRVIQHTKTLSWAFLPLFLSVNPLGCPLWLPVNPSFDRSNTSFHPLHWLLLVGCISDGQSACSPKR
jgi:hypothetical protein